MFLSSLCHKSASTTGKGERTLILQCSKVLLLTDEEFKLSYASGITCQLRIFNFLKTGEEFELKIVVFSTVGLLSKGYLI